MGAAQGREREGRRARRRGGRGRARVGAAQGREGEDGRGAGEGEGGQAGGERWEDVAKGSKGRKGAVGGSGRVEKYRPLIWRQHPIHPIPYPSNTLAIQPRRFPPQECVQPPEFALGGRCRENEGQKTAANTHLRRRWRARWWSVVTGTSLVAPGLAR